MSDTPTGAPAPDPETPLHPPLRASRRSDGWTAERQAAFLEHLADGVAVEHAAHMVGLTPASAYAFRRRAAGAAFALGWRAACLIARDKVADDLMARAYAGQTVTVVRPDGSEVTRHQYDNRLALHLLARLDRLAESADDGDSRAARMVASEFDAFLTMIERDEAAPARAGLFLARRLPGGGMDADGEARDLGPVLALAAADRFARTGCAVAAEVDIADLDPAARAGWSAEQWTRAEAAGLVAIATPAPPEPDSAIDPQQSQHSDAAQWEEPRVWWDEEQQLWQTSFPPPEDFEGAEQGAFGDDDYARDLTLEEEAMVEVPRKIEAARRAITEGEERDAWFAALAEEIAAAAEAEEERAGEEGRPPPLRGAPEAALAH